MQYLVNDSWGHCESQEQIDALRAAIETLNSSEVIGAMEEDANHHSDEQFRQEMADSLHIADIDGWTPSEYDDEIEGATCTICQAELEREVTLER